MLRTYEVICRSCASYTLDTRWADVIELDGISTTDFIKNTSIFEQSEEIEDSFLEYNRQCVYCGSINWQVDKIKINEINCHSHIRNNNFYVIKVKRHLPGQLNLSGNRLIVKHNWDSASAEFPFLAIDIAESYFNMIPTSKLVQHIELSHEPLVEIVISCQANTQIFPPKISHLRIEKFSYVGLSYKDFSWVFELIKSSLVGKPSKQLRWQDYV